jgi:hypothetical protein
MVVQQTTRLENDLAILELLHALEGTITKMIAQGLLKRTQGEVAVSLGQEHPVVAIVPAQPAGRLIGRTNAKSIAIRRLPPTLSKLLNPSKHTVVVGRVVALPNLVNHKGSNHFVSIVSSSTVSIICKPISLKIAVQASSKYIMSSGVNLSVCRLIKVVLVCLSMRREKPFLPMRLRSSSRETTSLAEA